MWIVNIIIINLSLNAVSFAALDGSYFICKNQKIARTLRIEKTPGRCRTLYSKNGQSQEIASGMNLGSCQKIMEDVKKNLTDNGWKCKELDSAGISEIVDKPAQ